VHADLICQSHFFNKEKLFQLAASSMIVSTLRMKIQYYQQQFYVEKYKQFCFLSQDFPKQKLNKSAKSICPK